MSFGDVPPEHLYINQTSPYYRAPHIYVSIAARFWPGRRALTEEEVARAGIMEGYYNDVSDVVREERPPKSERAWADAWA